MNQMEINTNKLYDSLDIKITLNKSNYLRDINSNIEFKDNDIILIWDIIQNIKLKSMISQLFKDKNKQIYNKLLNKKMITTMI